MQHEAARPKGGSFEDAPHSQPMRPAARGQIARNPSSDQKRVRRANTLRRSADWTPGEVKCRTCGYQGGPMMSGGATGPECSHCGSYEVSKVRPEHTGGEAYPENSRYLNQGDYSRQAAKDPNAYLDNICPGCGGPANHRNPEGTCNSCMPEVRRLMDEREDDDRYREAKVATVLDTRAEMLNPGDQIRNPNGRTQKVVRVRPHETSAKHVYVDTDGGTAVVERSAGFQVVPKNSQQQSLPGYGTPGGNANHLPFDPQSGNASNAAPSTQCPNCQGHGTLARQGDHYTCSRCGYREQFGGAGGHAFSDASSVVRTFSTINGSTMSAVARRAAAVANQEEAK